MYNLPESVEELAEQIGEPYLMRSLWSYPFGDRRGYEGPLFEGIRILTKRPPIDNPNHAPIAEITLLPVNNRPQYEKSGPSRIAIDPDLFDTYMLIVGNYGSTQVILTFSGRFEYGSSRAYHSGSDSPGRVSALMNYLYQRMPFFRKEDPTS